MGCTDYNIIDKKKQKKKMDTQKKKKIETKNKK